MSQQTQDRDEYVAIENERRSQQYHLNELNELYGPFKPVKKHYYSDRVEQGEFSPKAGVVTAQLTQETKQCNAVTQSAN